MYDSLGEKFDVFVLFNDTATTEIYTYLHTLSLHDARPICCKKLTAEDAEERRDTAPLCGLRVPCGDSSGSCFDRLDKDFCTNPLASCPRRRASMPAIAQSSQGEMDSRFRGNDDRGQFGGLMLRRARHEAFTIMNPLPEPVEGRVRSIRKIGRE